MSDDDEEFVNDVEEEDDDDFADDELVVKKRGTRRSGRPTRRSRRARDSDSDEPKPKRRPRAASLKKPKYSTCFVSSLCAVVVFLWLPYVIGQTIYIFILFLSSFFFFPRLISAVGDWMFTILWHMVWP